MKKYFFSYIEKPKLKDFREEIAIDKLYEIEDTYKMQTLDDFSEETKKRLIISDPIKNYKNTILMTKIQYCIADNYYKLSEKELEESNEFLNYDFLARLHFEDVIVKLYSAYDKTYHIVNAIFDLNVDSDKVKENFKKLVCEKVKEINPKWHRKLQSISCKIHKHVFDVYRDDIIHNKSISFTRFNKDYKLNYLNIKVDKAISIGEIKEGIIEIVDILYEQIKVINEMLEMFNKKYPI